MQGDIIRRFHAALPDLRRWIDDLLRGHERQARTVSTLKLTRVSACYPQDLLERAKMVTVDRVPFPPVDRLGLPELAPAQRLPFQGITFKDTYFLEQGHESESVHFHELVHVVQWDRLGVDNFLMAYGVGLLRSGYRECPLEQMAYSLQESFDHGTPPQDLVRLIETRTDAVWRQVALVLPAGGGG